jgi:hypothetical protein
MAQMMEQDPNQDEENVEEEIPIVRTIPGIDHLDQWMIEELERKKRLIGYLEQIEDEEVGEIKQFWFPNGLDGVPNLDPYKRFLAQKEEEETDEQRAKREEQGEYYLLDFFEYYLALFHYFQDEFSKFWLVNFLA